MRSRGRLTRIGYDGYVSHMHTTRHIKETAGYVQVESFSRAREGYFCGTCRALEVTKGQEGYCLNLQVPVKTYGCCNQWKLANIRVRRGADGRLLTR